MSISIFIYLSDSLFNGKIKPYPCVFSASRLLLLMTILQIPFIFHLFSFFCPFHLLSVLSCSQPIRGTINSNCSFLVKVEEHFSSACFFFSSTEILYVYKDIVSHLKILLDLLFWPSVFVSLI